MGLVTVDRRAVLKRLKMEFDVLFASLDAGLDPSAPEYVEAEAAYKRWRKAIDSEALDLLKDLELAEEKIGLLHEELRSLKTGQEVSPDPKLTDADAVALFETIDAAKQDPEASKFDPAPPEEWEVEPPPSVRQLASSLWIYPPDWTEPT